MSLPSARNRLDSLRRRLGALRCRAPAGASIFLVTSSADSGGGSLRSIIAAANADGSPPATINFSIGGCPCTITLLSDLPALTQQHRDQRLHRDRGHRQHRPDRHQRHPEIDLNANGFNALHFTAANSRVRGLAIRGAVGDGILIDASANGTTVDGNFIGTNPDRHRGGPGQRPWRHRPPGQRRHHRRHDAGGSQPDLRQYLGYGAYLSSTTDSSIEGNLIGTNAAGTGAVPNATASGTAGVQIGNVGGAATGNTVGGASAAARNVISGNGSDGVQILSENVHDNFVQGNYIGLGADGTTALGNGRHGVVLYHYAAGTPSSGNIDSRQRHRQPSPEGDRHRRAGLHYDHGVEQPDRHRRRRHHPDAQRQRHRPGDRPAQRGDGDDRRQPHPQQRRHRPVDPAERISGRSGARRRPAARRVGRQLRGLQRRRRRQHHRGLQHLPEQLVGDQRRPVRIGPRQRRFGERGRRLQ